MILDKLKTHYGKLHVQNTPKLLSLWKIKTDKIVKNVENTKNVKSDKNVKIVEPADQNLSSYPTQCLNIMQHEPSSKPNHSTVTESEHEHASQGSLVDSSEKLSCNENPRIPTSQNLNPVDKTQPSASHTLSVGQLSVRKGGGGHSWPDRIFI